MVVVVRVVVLVVVRRWLGCSARLRANQCRHGRPPGLFPTGTRCGFVGFRLVLDPGALLDPDALLDPKGSSFVARSDTAPALRREWHPAYGARDSAVGRVSPMIARRCGSAAVACGADGWDVGVGVGVGVGVEGGMWRMEDGGMDRGMYGRL